MRAFLYARVSTGEQNEGMQVREMLELAERRGWTPEVFTDVGWSGGKETRPELDRMMQLVRRGKCEVVLVYRFDRFARSTRHLVNTLDEFKARKVQFVSVHESIDTTTPMGTFAFQIFAAIAEFERAIIRERIKSGIAHARARGIRLGRPRRVADALKIRMLRSAGEPWHAVAKQAGVSIATAKRIAKNAPELDFKGIGNPEWPSTSPKRVKIQISTGRNGDGGKRKQRVKPTH
jgi:DNA invertase Pin-like site-specific DNA recombinase